MLHPVKISNSAEIPCFHIPFFSSTKLFALKTPQNNPAARHSPLMSQPEGMCRIAARGTSRPVLIRKPAQSIRLP